MTAQDPAAAPLRETPLADFHRALGAKMVPFAGYAMPVSYPAGIVAEHRAVRESAGLFDVSHMGQAVLAGSGHEAVARALEALVPGELQALKPGRIRYSVLLNEAGGIVDDIMVTRPLADDGRLMVVLNAARKEVDAAYIEARLPAGISFAMLEDRALLALQGPAAAAVMADHCPEATALGFMTGTEASFDGIVCHVSRSGYTGEDGFEISVAADRARTVAEALVADPRVTPAGLGARDSLRLEAGLCLYGHDIDETTSPVEADLAFIFGKRRLEAGDFPGAARILAELRDGPSRRRVGIRPDGRAPAREGTGIVDGEGRPAGIVTSGGFGPSLDAPVAMGYVVAPLAGPGTALSLLIRGKPHPARVAPMPFVPHRYHRKS